MTILQSSIVPPTGGYQISRSLRFNSADSAYLNRTFGTSTNQSIFTYSVWVKLGRAAEATIDYGELLSGYAASNDTGFGEFTIYNGKLRFSGWATIWRDSTQVFRDPSSWYHVILAVDTTQATAANRIKIYVNGSEITAFSTNNNPTQNSTVGINNNSTTGRIGQDAPASSTRLFDGYMAEANFIDGQALTPSSFGQTNSATGVWGPVKYTGTYGTNGFYLNFSDNSNTTSTTLGKDSSGNGNNWTPNNFSVTAGAGNDSLVDTPTSYGTDTGVGGEVRGNYATLNPLDISGTLANGNLDYTGPTASASVRATFGMTSGKWYWENIVTSTSIGFGIAKSSAALTTYTGGDANGWGYYGDGQKYTNNSGSAYGSTFTTNDIIGVAFDADAGSLYFYKNGVVQNSGTAAFTGLTSGPYFPGIGDGASGSAQTATANFGQRPFAYTAPSGFKALCTQNLPTPTIGATSTTQAGKYMNVVLYTGNGATGQTITGVGFQPDFTWIKCRSAGATSHYLADAVRGATKFLQSNTTAAEGTDNGITAFTSDGFSVGAIGDTNANLATFVAWNWKANGAGSTNTAGTITSTVSANTTAGFSIVTYTGNGTNGATVGHGLGVAPSMIIVKWRSGLTNNDWDVYHSSIGATGRLFLNLGNGTQTSALPWNNTAPSSTVFTLGTGSDVNNNTTTYVAYCFAAVAGYSAFGSYTGNGSTDGPFIFTGFRPRFVMFKKSSGVDNWEIIDTSRNLFNVNNNGLAPNSADAEITNRGGDILSNGFKLRYANGVTNESGFTYIYAAFAESPFKFSLAR